MPENDNSMPMQVGKLIATMESATLAISALTGRLDRYEVDHQQRWNEFVQFRADAKAEAAAEAKAEAKGYTVREDRSSEAGSLDRGEIYWVRLATGLARAAKEMPKGFWWLVTWLVTLAMAIIWASGQLPNLVQIYAEHHLHRPDIIIQRPEPVPSKVPEK